MINLEKLQRDLDELPKEAQELLIDFVELLKKMYSPSNQQETSKTLTLEQRRAFLKLPLSERRRILSQQAAEMEKHYQENTDWKEFLAGDIIDY
ncbi:hypothetical protein [Crocosphaera chwakensis]|uniref:DUF2281 domain-containing protein n=1 Tax=Crocosphaera chwakensis CCY0110 TaxID=391612 RepID=A3IK52_9CHRO|nr:hypothetical protein [Crocosphaera chwakensis]EAZ93041.1 hypothetical protein CY0110_03194 [Crocosphaera chwakensis CCY0110]